MWPEWAKAEKVAPAKSPAFPVDRDLNSKISLFHGDLTRLQVDAIVNAANESLLGGGGIDGAIHRAAGPGLRRECSDLTRCKMGDARISAGHRLPAKHVIHTVGPRDGSESVLASCYRRCMELALQNNIRSIAFCCIATGEFLFDNRKAADVALRTVREWLAEKPEHRAAIDRVIFCTFIRIDQAWYRDLAPVHFPLS